jgi:hypothetical protein
VHNPVVALVRHLVFTGHWHLFRLFLSYAFSALPGNPPDGFVQQLALTFVLYREVVWFCKAGDVESSGNVRPARSVLARRLHGSENIMPSSGEDGAAGRETARHVA